AGRVHGHGRRPHPQEGPLRPARAARGADPRARPRQSASLHLGHARLRRDRSRPQGPDPARDRSVAREVLLGVALDAAGHRLRDTVQRERMTTPAARRTYLDVLRGVAVLIMIEAHVIDSWTRETDRHSRAFGESLILGGFGAPLFLFLAGVGVAMSAGSKSRRLDGDDRAAAAIVAR